MIVSARPVDRTKGKGETYVACDACEAICEGSRVSGTRGDAIRKRASDLAKSLGWEDRFIRNDRQRSMKMTWTIQVLCPECAVKDADPVEG